MHTQGRQQSKWMVRAAGTGLAVTLIALVAVVATHREGRPPGPTDSGRLEDGEVGTAGTGRPQPRTRSRARVGSSPGVAMEPSYAVNVPATAGSADAKAPAQRAPSESERLAHAEAAFEAEVYDKSWAEPSRRIVEGHLAQFTESFARPGPVKCRSTLCRLDVAISGGTATAESYLAKLVRGRLWDGPAMFIRSAPDAAGEIKLTLFMAKEDTVLPEPSSVATM